LISIRLPCHKKVSCRGLTFDVVLLMNSAPSLAAARLVRRLDGS
jgi:hypothetical protein